MTIIHRILYIHISFYFYLCAFSKSLSRGLSSQSELPRPTGTRAPAPSGCALASAQNARGPLQPPDLLFRDLFRSRSGTLHRLLVKRPWQLCARRCEQLWACGLHVNSFFFHAIAIHVNSILRVVGNHLRTLRGSFSALSTPLFAS